MSNRPYKAWTQQEAEAALLLRKSGKTARAIATELNRTVCSVESFFDRQRMWGLTSPIPMGRERRPPITVTRPAEAPSADALAERDHRLSLAPRDLTAALMGDPAIGRSALDRR